MKTALLILEDGNKFYGESIGAVGESIGEIVFNTSMTGYQEIITDPSYARQIVTFTYPHIGNVGINCFDNESLHVQVAGLVIRNLSRIVSNFRSTLSLSDYLIQQNIVGISNIDTRKLTRLIREKGIQYAGIITCGNLDVQSALCRIRQYSKNYKLNTTYQVSTSNRYLWNQGTYCYMRSKFSSINTSKLPYHVVVYDFGVKHNIMRILVDHGCLLTVVPSNTKVHEIVNMHPDGILLSNGPGNPIEYEYAITSIQTLLHTTDIPIFGICLGHQLLALANGAKIIKMKFGHHGSNHPVKDLESNKVLITVQNHNFVVDMLTLPNILKITHISLFDGTLQGIRHNNKPVFGFQGHPESSPGSQDSAYIFNNFIKLIKDYRNRK